MPLPLMVRLRQHFERPRIRDIPFTVRQELERLNLGSTIKPGQTIALTAGSRGIAHIPVILKATVQFLRDLGAQPFLVPTMGSHGGGTAGGQQEVLESYGITEGFVGAPIKASMDVISLGDCDVGYPVYLDKHASEADHIAVIGRIKPHTGFHGALESGLCKMMMIGLGKHVGALHYHRILLEQPWEKVLRSVVRHMMAKSRIAFGLAVVENAYDETALIESVPPSAFIITEETLLVKARQWLPRLPFNEADLLIIDEIGKNISGSGMDTNVVGRKRAFGALPPAGQPSMRFIFVRGLSAQTHGNAAGIGLADFTTNRLIKSMNYQTTIINCLTAGYPDNANLPVHFNSDREVMEAAVKIIGTRTPEQARIMHIRNTLKVEEVEVSQPCLTTLRPQGEFEVLGAPKAVEFDADGNLRAI